MGNRDPAKIERQALSRRRVLDKMLIKLDEYKDEVLRITRAYDSIQDRIMETLSTNLY
jgi:hypothetical protein